MRKILLAGLVATSALMIAGCGESAEKAETTDNSAEAAAPAEEAADANATEGGDEAATAAAGARQDFTIVNSTGRTVLTLNVSSSDSNEWGPDILGAATIPDGQSGQVAFQRGQEQCLWDLRATFDDGSTGDWRGVNLCEASTVTLTPTG